MGTPEFVVSQAEMQISWGPHLQLPSEVGLILMLLINP